MLRSALYEETGHWVPSLALVRSVYKRLQALTLRTVLRAAEFLFCLGLIGFIFLSDLVPIAPLLLFPIQGWVALRFSQVCTQLSED